MSAKNTSVSLGEPLVAFMHKQVGEGRYGSISDVVRAGLRLLEEQETRLDILRQALVDGENSGPSGPFDLEEFLAQMHAEHAAE